MEGLAEGSGSELPQFLLTQVYEFNLAVFFRRLAQNEPGFAFEKSRLINLVGDGRYGGIGEGVPAGFEELSVGFAVRDNEAVAGDVGFAGFDGERT